MPDYSKPKMTSVLPVILENNMNKKKDKNHVKSIYYIWSCFKNKINKKIKISKGISTKTFIIFEIGFY